MCALQDRSQSNSIGEAFLESRDFGEVFTRNEKSKVIFEKANSVSLLKIFNYYNVSASDSNRKITCPFSFHKNGVERTPSFWFYPDRNNFHCFGCKNGGSSIDFVALYDGINKYEAAIKINELFESDGLEFSLSENNFEERADIIISFSSKIRELLILNINNENNLNLINKALYSFDMLNDKFVLKNKALKSLSEKILKSISHL